MNQYEKTETPEYNKGKEDGIIAGIRYWDINRSVCSIINKASHGKDTDEKRKILSESKGYMSHLYDIADRNKESKEIKRQQKGLETLADQCGFIITENEIFLKNQ